MMKIYFCGSIRGGRKLAETYNQLISLLQSHGKVLTEHIGDNKELVNRDSLFGDKQIHDRDLSWIRESDIVIAEVTVPSLGVGYEIGRAIDLNKPILCLFDSNSPNILSAMIAGSPDLNIFPYSHIKEAADGIRKFISQHAPDHTSGSS